MAQNTEKSVKKLLLRLPEKTWNKVWQRAKKNSRSINGQISYELEQQ